MGKVFKFFVYRDVRNAVFSVNPTGTQWITYEATEETAVAVGKDVVLTTLRTYAYSGMLNKLLSKHQNPVISGEGVWVSVKSSELPLYHDRIVRLYKDGALPCTEHHERLLTRVYRDLSSSWVKLGLYDTVSDSIRVNRLGLPPKWLG